MIAVLFFCVSSHGIGLKWRNEYRKTAFVLVDLIDFACAPIIMFSVHVRCQRQSSCYSWKHLVVVKTEWWFVVLVWYVSDEMVFTCQSNTDRLQHSLKTTPIMTFKTEEIYNNFNIYSHDKLNYIVMSYLFSVQVCCRGYKIVFNISPDLYITTTTRWPTDFVDALTLHLVQPASFH